MTIVETLSAETDVLNKETAVRIDSCRACGSHRLDDIFTLGEMQVARFIADGEPAVLAPLTFARCDDCTYLQLRHNIKPGLVFYDEYGYESGVNPAMIRELGGIVESTKGLVNLKDGDIWLDIASNDGTLLLQVEGDVFRVGFDPSRGVAIKGAQRLIEKFGPDRAKVIVDYFNRNRWVQSCGDRKAKVVTAIAVFYSVQKPNEFLADVKRVLDPEGVFVVQQNYTPEMISQLAFCNAVHEHVTYPTLTAFKSLVERYGFKMVDVLINEINGGSFRVYLKHDGALLKIEEGEERIKRILDNELKSGYLDKGVYESFGNLITEKGKFVTDYLKEQVRAGKKVYGLAASTRGNTRLQAWGIGPELLSGIAERNPRKVGRKTLGIPIVSDEEALRKADVLFVSIWFYGDSVIEQYKDYLNCGGIMLFPSGSDGNPYLVEMVDGEIVKRPLTPNA